MHMNTFRQVHPVRSSREKFNCLTDFSIGLVQINGIPMYERQVPARELKIHQNRETGQHLHFGKFF